MASATSGIVRKLGVVVSICVGVYALILGILMTPDAQRFALYANKINTLWLHDVEKPEMFGFSPNQVTPFAIQTKDSQQLYAWHVLPIDIYVKHEEHIKSERRIPWKGQDMRNHLGIRLINSDNTSKVVINFHGNAGHIAQGWRTDTYRMIASQPNTHVFTIDYRGFGHSEGVPTEAGLIADGISLISWVMENTNVSADRIVILGQSLGTAVSAAAALYFANPTHALLPLDSPEMSPLRSRPEGYAPVIFARVILVAAFSNIPSMLLTYRMGGVVPILLPIRPVPFLAEFLTSKVKDQWRTGDRLVAYYTLLMHDNSLEIDSQRGTIHLIHAKNDLDISYKQTKIIHQQILNSSAMKKHLDDTAFTHPDIEEHTKASIPSFSSRIRCEIVEYGGHNPIIVHSPVLAGIVLAYK